MNKWTETCVVVAVAVAIGGCGNSKNEDSGRPPPGAMTESAAAVPAPVVPATPAPGPGGQTMMESVHVAVADTGTGIPATVNLLDAAGNTAATFAKTNQQGDARVNRPCNPYDQFQVEPNVGAYLVQDPLPCATTLSFKVYSAQVAYEMIRTGDAAFTQGRFTEAHRNYMLAAERFRISDPKESVATNARAQLAAGQALGIQDPTASANGTLEHSPEAVAKLRSFQRESALPVTGVLDVKTSEALGQVSVPEARRRAAKFSMAHGAINVVPNTGAAGPAASNAAAAAVAAPATPNGAAEAHHMVAPAAPGMANHHVQEVLVPAPGSPPR